MYPPGTLVEDMDPSYVAESNLPRILGVLSTLHAIAFFAVLARLYVRIRLVKSVARDDWTMVAATLCATGGLIMFIIQGTYGLGRHTDVLSGGEMAKINELTFWMSIISSAAGIALLKISIGLNLLRLSSERWYIWSIWASIGAWKPSHQLTKGLTDWPSSVCVGVQLHGHDDLFPTLQAHGSSLGLDP